MSFDHMGEISDKEPGDVTAEIIYQYMEGTMKCPHLAKWVVSVCKAVSNTYVPSNFELQEYCKTKSHKKCPFFLKNTAVKREADGLISA